MVGGQSWTIADKYLKPSFAKPPFRLSKSRVVSRSISLRSRVDFQSIASATQNRLPIDREATRNRFPGMGFGGGGGMSWGGVGCS